MATAPDLRPRSGRSGDRARRAVALVAVATVALVAVACSDGNEADLVDPSPGPTVAEVPTDASVIPAEDASTPTLSIPADFVAPDTRNVSLAPVVGDPDPGPDPEDNVVPVRGGEATLRVTVLDPEGKAVEGATVRYERFVGPYRGWEDVVADDEGVAELTEAIGGRYRVRAWLRPSLATTDAQLTFLAATDEADLVVQVEPHDQRLLQARLTVPTWVIGDVVAFEVLYVQEEVGDDGVVRGAPLQAEATVTALAGTSVVGENRAVTDAEGRAVFALECRVNGLHQVLVAADGQLITVELSVCEPRPADAPPLDQPTEAPTTTQPAAPGPASSTTSTTAPGSTTTTAPAVAVAVGATFTVPFAGPLGAGTYVPQVTGGADPNDCVTDLEVAVGNRWIRQQATGTLRLATRARSLTAASGTDACTYRRTR